MKYKPMLRNLIFAAFSSAYVWTVFSPTAMAAQSDLPCEGKSGEAALILGLELFNTKDRWDSAGACFELSVEKTKAQGLYMLGLWHTRRGEQEKALQITEQALELAGQEEREKVRAAHVSLAIKLLRAGNREWTVIIAWHEAALRNVKTDSEKQELAAITRSLFRFNLEQLLGPPIPWEQKLHHISLMSRFRQDADDDRDLRVAKARLFLEAVKAAENDLTPLDQRKEWLVVASGLKQYDEDENRWRRAERSLWQSSSTAAGSGNSGYTPPPSSPLRASPDSYSTWPSTPADSTPETESAGSKGYLRYLGLGLMLITQGDDQYGAVLPLQAVLMLQYLRLGLFFDLMVISNRDSPSGGNIEGSAIAGGFGGATLGLGSRGPEGPYADVLLGAARFEDRCLSWEEAGPNQEDPSESDYSCTSYKSYDDFKGLGFRFGYFTKSIFDLGVTLYVIPDFGSSISGYVGFKTR